MSSYSNSTNALIQKIRTGLVSENNEVLLDAVTSVAEAIGIEYINFLDTDTVKALWPHHINYTVRVMMTQPQPQYILTFQNQRVEAKSEAQALLIGIILLMFPEPKKHKLTFNIERYRKAINSSTRGDQNYKNEIRTRSIDYLGMVFQNSQHINHSSFSQHMGYRETEKVKVFVKKYPDVAFSDSTPMKDLIIVGADGKWFGDGPWIALAQSCMDDFEFETNAAVEAHKAATEEAARLKNMETATSLELAGKILLGEEKLTKQRKSPGLAHNNLAYY